MQARSLAQQQSALIRALNEGPDALDADLFAGSPDRILISLAAHANTIGHARLMALERSFPKTMAAMGNIRFNTLTRAYCDTQIAQANSSNTIGAGFCAYLAAHYADTAMADLARIEWAWLTCYHAAEAPAFTVHHFAGLHEAALLETRVIQHPAAAVVILSSPLSGALADIGGYDTAEAVLITRPNEAVHITATDTLTASVFAKCHTPVTISDLLALTMDAGDEAAMLAPIITLVRAGALVINAAA
jgi:Putative DNA-binding domain